MGLIIRNYVNRASIQGLVPSSDQLDGDAITELMLERGIGVVKQPVYLYEVASKFFDFDGGES